MVCTIWANSPTFTVDQKTGWISIAVGDKIVLTLWPDYLAVVPTFKIMFLAVPFIFLAFPTGNFLNAIEKQKITALNRGVLMVASLGLNILLIPRLGLLGAGISFLISNALVFFLDLCWVQPALKLDKLFFLKIILKTAVASSIMYLTLVYFKEKSNLLVLIFIGLGVYFAGLYAVGGINLQKIKQQLSGQDLSA